MLGFNKPIRYWAGHITKEFESLSEFYRTSYLQKKFLLYSKEYSYQDLYLYR